MLSTLTLPSVATAGLVHNVTSESFVDPFANVAFVGASEGLLRADTLRALQRGTFPMPALSAFLHENEHHRCFDSPVGLALLGIEALSRLNWHQALKCRHAGSVAACAANPTCANRALVRELLDAFAPLAEGLALFVELDGEPGASAAASAILLNAASVFFHDDMRSHLLAGGRAPFDPVRRRLAAERTDEKSHFQRTRSLLSELSHDRTNPYVTGYRWISQLVSDIHSRAAAAAADTDMTAAFLSSYFFDDFLLSALIASCAWDVAHGRPTMSSTAIYEYVSERTRLLREGDVAAWFDEYAAGLVGGRARASSFLHPELQNESRLQWLGAQVRAAELYWRAPNVSRGRVFFRFGAMTLDSLDIDVQATTLHCVVDDLALRVPLLADGAPLGTDGALRGGPENSYVELLTVLHQPVICFFHAGNLVGATDRDFRSLPAGLAEPLLGSLATFEDAEAWRSRHWELLNPPAGTSCRAYLETRQAAARDAIQMIYVR